MKKEKDLTFKEYIKIALWTFKITWQISPWATLGSLFSEIISRLRSVVDMYVFAKLIDTLISIATQEGAEVKDLFPFLLILLLINLFFTLVGMVRSYSSRILRRLSRPILDKMAYGKIHSLGVQTMELPDMVNESQKMRDWLYIIVDVDSNIVRMLSFAVSTIFTGAIIITKIPIVIPILIVIAIVSFLQRKHFFKKDFDWNTNREHLMQKRKAFWIGGRLSDPRDIGEISVIGAFGFMDKKFTDFFTYFNSGLLKIMKADSLSGFLVSMLSNFGILFGYMEVFGLLLGNQITIGDTTFLLTTITSFYNGIEGFSAEIVAFRDFVMKAKEVYGFFNLESVVTDGDFKLPRLEEPPIIEIKNISFHYPNSKENIFKDFSLTIKKGEKIAIVGENGVGKTTLIKLISRIYDPQEGEILINGINLKDIKINDWYKNIGVLFQEYNFYGELTARENIYIGKSMKEIDEGKIIEAAKNADAHNFIKDYKYGYDTIMSERFDDGIRPSSGQRQKIAIARFFYRNAPVAIFDEPTSSIDAESEYRIFNRIYKFFENKTVVIISHRFSTVRNADRILVLHEGKIDEEGTHKELLKKEGRYFNSFSKQAKGYTI